MTEETLFAQAIALLPEERSVFLDEACRDDVEMGKRIEILLRSHDEAGTLLANPAEQDLDATLPFIGDDRAQTATLPTEPELPSPKRLRPALFRDTVSPSDTLFNAD